MITGYNTDVRLGKRIYHVQTEDRGINHPRMETLIYVSGEILDSHRSSYADLATLDPFPMEDVRARMDEQHKAVIRLIKSGHYDDWRTTKEEDAAANPDPLHVDRPLDDAILEFLDREGQADLMELVALEPIDPVLGDLVYIRVAARLCVSLRPLADAAVTVKLVSAQKKSKVLTEGRTDEEGVFECQVELPSSVPGGSCSLLVACSAAKGSDEVRAAIHGA